MASKNLRNSFNQNPSIEEVDAFVRAAGRGDDAAVTQFVDKYPDSVDHLNFYTYVRETALMAAAEAGHKSTVELLLSKGASVNAENSGGIPATALSGAAGAGQTEIVDLLLKHGADIEGAKTPSEEERQYQWTPLMRAVWYLHVDTVEFLLKRGASISQKSIEGTVLMQAQNQQKFIQEQIDSGHEKEWMEESLKKLRAIIKLLEQAVELQNKGQPRLPRSRRRALPNSNSPDQQRR